MRTEMSDALLGLNLLTMSSISLQPTLVKAIIEFSLRFLWYSLKSGTAYTELYLSLLRVLATLVKCSLKILGKSPLPHKMQKITCFHG